MNEGEFGKEYGTEILENGLVIHFYDQSRPIAGDRCFVQLLMRVPIPRPESYFSDSETPPSDLALFLSGSSRGLAFTQTKSRNFIAMEEAPTLLAKMKDQLIKASRSYLANSSFAKRFVMKQYDEWKKSSACQLAHRKVIAEIEQKERESE